MAGILGVADGTGPLLLHVDTPSSGVVVTGGTTTGGITSSGITTSGTVSSTTVTGSSGVASGLAQYQHLPSLFGTGVLGTMVVVGGVLLTGALFAGVGLLSYAVTKAAIEP